MEYVNKEFDGKFIDNTLEEHAVLRDTEEEESGGVIYNRDEIMKMVEDLSSKHKLRIVRTPGITKERNCGYCSESDDEDD